MASFRDVMVLLLLVVACAVVPGALCGEAGGTAGGPGARPQIYRADNGTLHINSGANETVLIDGVDLVAENSRLSSEVAALKQRRESDSETGWIPLCDRPFTLCMSDFCASDTCTFKHRSTSVFVGVKHVIGNIELRDMDSASIHHFSNVESISGYLSIYRTSALNVDGFSSLTSVGGDLAVQSNVALTNVDGFSSLTSVGGTLTVDNNDVLTNVDGFASLASVDGNYIRICGNHKLSSIFLQARLTLTNVSVSEPVRIARSAHASHPVAK